MYRLPPEAAAQACVISRWQDPALTHKVMHRVCVLFCSSLRIKDLGANAAVSHENFEHYNFAWANP